MPRKRRPRASSERATTGAGVTESPSAPAAAPADAPAQVSAAAPAEAPAEAPAAESTGGSVDVLATTQAQWAKCPACGVQNATDARFCERCGSELAHPEAATLLFAPRGSGGTERGASDAATVVQAAGAQGQVPVLTHTLSGANADTLLQLVRRDLAEDYDVDCEIGRGGMAIVYRAVERQLRRTVALKVLPPDLLLGPQVVERFKREAQMAAALDHPSIIPIYRVGETSALIYLAMRYVEGRALDRIITGQGPLPLPVVILVLRAATAALAYAHAHGIVHRDVKGGNILIDREGRVIVTDFGVARAIDNASMTTTGSVIGTPYFMSPEQCAGKVVGPQSDQYSMGVVAFQMLIGAVPFQADTLAAIMHHHFFTPAPDVTKGREDVPPALAAVLSRVLSKDPERRFASTGDMLAAVEAIPLSTIDRAKGEAMLRDLAQGTTLPTVETSALPPLADTMTVVAAHDAFRRSADRVRRVRRRMGSVAALMVVGVIVLWASMRPGSRGGGGADTTSIGRVSPIVVAQPPSPVPPLAMVRPSGVHNGTTVAVTPAGTPVLHRHMMPPPPDTTHAVAVPDTATGKLRVRAKPGDADIQIDGEVIGQGAIIDREVLVGERRLRVSAPGYVAFDTAIVIVAGETTRLNPITLKAEP